MEQMPYTTEASTKQDWSGLQRGQQVTVTEPTKAQYNAIIDDMTPARDVVWILAAHGIRRVFGYREGVIVSPVKAISH